MINIILKDDLELLLLSGLPIELNIGNIYPLKLKDIVKLRYSKYNSYISLLLIDKSQLNNNNDNKDIDLNQITNFDIVFSSCLMDEQFRISYFNMLEVFFKETIQLGNGFFYFGNLIKNELDGIGLESNRIIYKNNFNEIVNLLKQINSMKNKEENEFNPANDKAKEIADRMKKAREKINKVKAKSGEDLSLSDLISAFAFYNKNTDLNSIFEMTIYQFNNQFQRMQLVNNYEISVQSLLHGADPKKVEIKNFITKL